MFRIRSFLLLSMAVVAGCAVEGKTDCAYGDAACSVCAVDLETQLRGMRVQTAFDMNVPDAPAIHPESHVQGVFRLADGTDASGQPVGRVGGTQNAVGGGLDIGFHRRDPQMSEGWLDYDPALGRVRFDSFDRVDVRDTLNHPGGTQAHGNIVAIAMEEQGNPFPSAAVYFVAVAQNDSAQSGGEIVNRLIMDGSRGEPLQAERKCAASAGFVKVSDGRFMVAVAGADNGKQGIWFYISDQTTLDANTTWQFISFWEPTCFGDDPNTECYYGAGGGLNLVTDCSGQVYLLAMNGSYLQVGGDHSTMQAYALNLTSTGEIEMQKRTTWLRTGLDGLNQATFRWGGSVYTSRDGTVVAMAAKRNNGPLGGLLTPMSFITIQQFVNPAFE
ncbi:MAG: hypothetical protein R3A47_05815 [Polyangiales bacterium]